MCDGEFDESLAVEVRVLMALHIARSYRLKRLFDDVVGGDDQIADVVERALKNRTARAGYQRQFGKPMTREAIEELARAARNDMTEGNRLWVERLSDVYNKALSFLARWHVQVVRVRRRAYGFMTGDSPVVVADKHRQRVGLALGGAGFVFMPIGRFTGATMTSQPLPEAELDPRVVQELNTLMRRNCIRHLACHPDDDWRRSLGLAPLK